MIQSILQASPIQAMHATTPGILLETRILAGFGLSWCKFSFGNSWIFGVVLALYYVVLHSRAESPGAFSLW